MGGTQTRPPYFQFGAYRHGPFSGISKRTQEHENLCKYINSLLRTHADPEATWTSFVLGYNNSVPWHRDLHNDKDSRNYTCAFGSFTGGAGNPREHGGITGANKFTCCMPQREHGSLGHLIDALRKRGASEEVLKAAKVFKCSICHERQRVQPTHLASLEPLPPKWHTVSADVGHRHHPTTGEDVQFLVMLDENTRFRTARILTRGSKQQPSATHCLNYFQEGWVQYFGLPRTLRLDPAGAFRSQALEAFCDKHSIFLDVAPAEARWKIGSIEQAAQGIKEVLGKVHEDDPSITPDEALANTVRVFNHREQVRGFTPAQLALGRNADDTDRLVAEPHRLPPDLLVENSAGEFQRDVQRRAAADKAHCEWHANQRLLRAQHSRPRRVYDYVPGELVFFWRSQESNKSRRAPGGKHGRFLGPACIPATRRDEAGHLRPGSSVWCIRGKQVIKCCPEQLRRASEREALLEELSSEAKVPWTFTKVAEELGGNQFQDFSKEAPDDVEWARA